jgi:hypothetical protein
MFNPILKNLRENPNLLTITIPIIIVGIFGIICLKGLPLYTIRHDPCKLCDILFGLMLFIMYLKNS